MGYAGFIGDAEAEMQVQINNFRVNYFATQFVNYAGLPGLFS